MLKPILSSIDELDEGVAKLYSEVEEDGETYFRLDVESADGWELANTRGLKRALEKERHRARGKETEGAQELENLRDEVADLKAKLAEGKKASSKASDEQAQAKIDELVRLHEEKETSWKTEKADLEKDLHHVLIEQSAREALRNGGFKDAERALSLDLLNCLRMGRDAHTGKRIVEVIDPDTGSPRVGDAQGNPMTVEGRVKEYLEDPYWKRFADGANATGGGLTGGGTEKVAKASSPDFESLSPEQKVEAAWADG